MIDNHQRHPIEVMRLPQVCGDADVVLPVSGDQLIAAYLDPIFRLGCRLGFPRLLAQAERRTPDEISDKAHLPAIVSEHERARAIEPLVEDYRRAVRQITLQIELGLHKAVGPED